MNCTIDCAFGPSTPGVTSTSTSRSTSSGWRSASARAVIPPRDMPTTAVASGASARTTSATSSALRATSRLPADAAVGVAVAREVDRHQGPVQRQGDGVPRVGVLGAAVEQHELGWGLSPHERGEMATLRHLDALATHGRRALVGDPVLGGVVLEVGELVVGDALDHGRVVPVSAWWMRPHGHAVAPEACRFPPRPAAAPGGSGIRREVPAVPTTGGRPADPSPRWSRCQTRTMVERTGLRQSAPVERAAQHRIACARSARIGPGTTRAVVGR